MKKHKRSESGQAIFLIAMALIVLLGFTSLAMDGGRVYSDRRKAQNTADASAFAGALVIAQSDSGDPTNLPPGTFTAVIAAAQARAVSNGYDDSVPEVIVDVGIEVRSDNGIYYLIRVTITSQIETTFAHLVYDGELKNTVYAVAKARPPQNLGFGLAMYGVSKTNCNTIWFAGNQNMIIHGGGILSNSSADSNNCDAMSLSGNGDVNVIGGGVGAVGGFDRNGNGNISPSVDEGLPQLDIPLLSEPDCSGLPNMGGLNLIGAGGGTTTINPGIYSNIKVGGFSKLVMNPGMYCITGSTGFTGLGGEIDGNGVLIYMQNGSFDLGGNAKVRLFASTDLIDASGNQWAGMLLYMPVYNTGTVTLTGGSSTKYRGTVYAPGPASPSSKSKCVVSGTAGTISVASQLICYSIKLTGNANINLRYNSSQNYSLPASIGLQE